MATQNWRKYVLVTLSILMILGPVACSSNGIMDMAFLSLTVKAVDENNNPLPNAIIESSDGQKVTADASGTAKLKFGAIGVHQITVLAQDRVPASFSVTMPIDQGDVKTVRLGKIVEINASFNVNIGGNISGLMMGQLYPMLFQSMFSAYGYSMDLTSYTPGQWTEWKLHNDDGEPMLLRKASLKRLDNKQEWWGMYIKGNEADENMHMEVLFSANKDSVRRMRQRIGTEEASEVPVTENWYSQPTRLTKESLEASIKQRGVNIKVAAGTFKADVMEFGSMASGGKVRMWRVTSVPGGVVRTEATDANNEVVWWSELTGQGSGAKTQLSSY